MAVLETLVLSMPPLARTGLVGLFALASACTAIIDRQTEQSPPASQGTAGTTGGTVTEPQCSGASLLPTRVRKITDVQYARLVSDLLPNATVPKVATPGTELALIKDDAKFVVRGPLAAQYWDGAFALAAEAVKRPGFVPCSPAPTEPTERRACATKLVDDFGPKVFRRPLTSQDREPLLAVYDVGAESSFEKGIELMLAALLQSADFLYRTELGDPSASGAEAALAPYEVASFLSFLLLGSGPDQELYAAAQNGSLATEAGVGAQLERLLALPAARERVTELVADVLGAGSALTSLRDPATYPELTPALRQAMDVEARDFVQQNVFAGGTLSDLFTSRAAKLDGTLAAFYGVTLTDPAARVELPATQRSGILTRGATVLGLPTGSRAVHRGLFIANNYLCRVLAPPPASLQGEIAQTLALGLNERQVAELRASKATCAGCHASFDGLGLAYEHYDFIGRYLTERDGAPVDAHGDLSFTDVDGTFDDLLELSERFAHSKTVAECLPQRFASQALGATLEDSEKCSVSQLIEPWVGGEPKLGALVPLLVQSQLFLSRKKVN